MAYENRRLESSLENRHEKDRARRNMKRHLLTKNVWFMKITERNYFKENTYIPRSIKQESPLSPKALWGYRCRHGNQWSHVIVSSACTLGTSECLDCRCNESKCENQPHKHESRNL